MSNNLDYASPKKPQSPSRNQQQQILLPHGQGHVTIPHGQVHIYSDKSSNPTTTTTTTATGAGQRLLTAREREALIEDLQLEAQTRIRKLHSHYELAARALRAKILMRINRVPRRYWDMTLRELQTSSSSLSSGLVEAGVSAVKRTGDGVRVTKSASTGSKPKPNNNTTSGGSVAARTSTVSAAATAAAAIRRTGRVAAGVRHGTALSAEAGRRGLTRSLRSRGN